MVKNDEFRALPRPDLEAVVVSERRRLDEGEARWLSMVAVVDDQRRGDASVAVSTTAWLAQACRLRYREAAGKVALARSLGQMPKTAAAVAAGEVSPSQARVLAKAHRAHPETFAAHEATLVDAARTLTVRQLGKAVAYWRQAQDYDAALDDANRLYDQRRLHVSETLGGMGRIDGDTDPESHATIRAALKAADDAATDSDDPRTPAQRRHDALVRVCRHYLDTAHTPRTGGERPHLSVILDLASLEGRAGRRCELARYGVIHPETARRLACDAAISRIIPTGSPSPSTRPPPQQTWAERPGPSHRGGQPAGLPRAPPPKPDSERGQAQASTATTASSTKARYHSTPSKNEAHPSRCDGDGVDR